MNYRFTKRAEEELQDAQDHYDSCVGGLGEEFLSEIDDALNKIISNPLTWGKLSRNCRRYLVERFPYGVIYQIHNDHILIVSIFHLSRRPSSWRKNLKS